MKRSERFLSVNDSLASAPDLAWQLLECMVRIRTIEEQVAERYKEQQIRCPVHLSIGQEAVAAGICAALRPDDQVMSSHRSHGHYLAKGGNLPAMIAEYYGKQTGCSRGRGGSMHLVDLKAGFVGAVPIVASTIPIATGLAFANQLRRNDRVVVAFFGEAATEEGVFHESANFASLRRLPIVFVCENNFYSVYSPLAVRQPAQREVFEQALGHGLEAYQGDGNDPEAVYQIGLEAVEFARSGRGAVFLEFKTYRWREHCGPDYDNHIGYRTESEFQAWKIRDPIVAFCRKLEARAIFDAGRLRDYEQVVQAEVASAFAAAQDAPFPHSDSLLDYVYA